MPRRRRRPVDLIRVHVENDYCGLGPKLFFSIENEVSRSVKNDPYARAVSATYTSDTSTEWETSDEDDEDSETEGAVALSEEKKVVDLYCECQVDNNEPGDSSASNCKKCNKSKVASQNPDVKTEERKTKKTKKKYHECQLLSNFTAETIAIGNSSKSLAETSTITKEESDRMFNELLEQEDLEDML